MLAKTKWAGVFSWITAVFITSSSFAIRVTEPAGAAHGYPGLCDINGKKLADAEFRQWAENDHLNVVITYKFPDGQMFEEKARFRQERELVQEQWSWKELGDMAAEFIGWKQSPFQAEVGFASLGIGIAGVIAFRASLPFRFATLIPPSVFSLGAAGGHIYQMIAAHNFSPGNVGLVLPSNFLIPVVGFVLLWLSYKHPKRGTPNHKLI
jgi:hypothetical protein